MTLKERQFLAAYDTRRSSYGFTPPALSIARAKLDLALANAERARQQASRIADMEADISAHAKSGEMKADGQD